VGASQGIREFLPKAGFARDEVDCKNPECYRELAKLGNAAVAGLPLDSRFLLAHGLLPLAHRGPSADERPT